MSGGQAEPVVVIGLPVWLPAFVELAAVPLD